jgi:non-specific serine/threonine protein kinase
LWLERLDAEQANVRAALDYLLACGDADAALRLSGAVWGHWQSRGHWTEGRRFLAAALALGGDAEPARLVDALWGAAFLALWQGDVDAGEELANRLLDISQQAGLERGKSAAIHVLAIVARQRGDLEKARALNEEALPLARRLDDDWLVSVVTNNLGDLLMEEGEFERAAELFEESLAIGEARGDLDRRARALVNLGYAAYRLGDGARAHDLLGRALTAAEEIGLVEGQLWALIGIAAYEGEAGDAVVAARLLGRIKKLESDLGSAEDDQGEEFERRTLATLRVTLGPERLAAELAAGAGLSLEEAIDLALGRSADHLASANEAL